VSIVFTSSTVYTAYPNVLQQRHHLMLVFQHFVDRSFTVAAQQLLSFKALASWYVFSSTNDLSLMIFVFQIFLSTVSQEIPTMNVINITVFVIINSVTRNFFGIGN
jgi:hypothetical protein